jgi:hypothetical protein
VTDEQITALKALRAKMTPGEWRRRRNRSTIFCGNERIGSFVYNENAAGIVALVNAADELLEQAAENARLRAGIAWLKAKGVSMQNKEYADSEKYIGWGLECAGEWLEHLAQEAQETQP